MSIGELISAAVVDERVWDAYQESAPDGIYLVGQPGPALSFVIFRAWKVPTGFVSEEIRLVGPSGRTLYRWGPEVRRMKGAMDLTVEVDRIDDAVLEETGTYVASFILEGEILGEIEFPVYVQAAAQKLPKETEEGLRKSDVIWVGHSRERTQADGAGVVRVQGREDLRAVVPRSRPCRSRRSRASRTRRSWSW